MLTRSNSKKSKGRSLGALNILFVAIICTVLGGILLRDTQTATHSDFEMQQYLPAKPSNSSTRSRSVYNPFALFAESPLPLKKYPQKNWVITDVELERDSKKRHILDGIIQSRNADKSTRKTGHTRNNVKDLFEELKPVKLAIEAYFNQHHQWPDSLKEANIMTLPTSISSISLASRGKLTLKLRGSEDTIDLTPQSATKSIEWFCQTTLQNYFLGQGVDRLCIERRKQHSVGKL